MKTPALILGFLVACVAAITGCDDDPARPASPAKDITAFRFLVANNPALTADVAATINGTAISAFVPTGTNVTALVATFDTTGAGVSVAGVGQASGVTKNDFTSPVTYRVAAADVTTRNYVVTVTIAPATAKQITAFTFLKANNTALAADVTATINGTEIAATVPFGTSVTSLVATFSTTGTSVTVAANAQVSGTTANNFTSAVTYRVLAADGSSQDYTVTMTIAKNTAKEITSYKFLSAGNGDLGENVTATINGLSISAIVPHGTTVTTLIATFETTGTSVTVGTAVQESGTTPNNFTNDVQYTVTAADQSTKTYTVKVTIAESNAKQITSYKFLSTQNPSLLRDITATINGESISATVPFDADVTELIATFEHTGASVAVGEATQTSGQTKNNFTNPVGYTVTAADDSTKPYTVTVERSNSTDKEITSFKFLAARNPGVLQDDVTATINGPSISATVPFGTDVTELVATFDHTGDRVIVDGAIQTSDITPNNFTDEVPYKVIAAGGSSQTYAVKVTVAKSNAKQITSYKFLSTKNPSLHRDITAVINGDSITAIVPFDADVTALVASFEHTGVSVTVGTTEQTSGDTPNNFTNPVEYTVTAADDSTKLHKVTVERSDSTAKEITSFKFLAAKNPGVLDNDVTATINGLSISATVPFGTTVTALIATFEHTGDRVTVNDAIQTSDITPNNFTADVPYKVIAAGGGSQIYAVKVSVAKNTAKQITSYKFLSTKNPSLHRDINAAINGESISAIVPFDADVTALVASFEHTGASVTVGTTVQTSGDTPNNFTSPVDYQVTAADDSTKPYKVTVERSNSTDKEITSFKFLAAKNPGVLDNDVSATINADSISATVPFGTHVTDLIATFEHTGDRVTVNDAIQTSDITHNNFTADVPYKVIAAGASSQTYAVKVTVAKNTAKQITSYKFLSTQNPSLHRDITAVINGDSISAIVPFDADVTALVATFEHTGTRVTVADVPQDSGQTANDFTSLVEYTVTAADDSTKAHKVTVERSDSTDKEITSFKFLAAKNPGVLDNDVTATIDADSISATVPFGTNVTDLIATFEHSGDRVTVNDAIQTSDITHNNFTADVPYKVIAAGGSSRIYEVKVTIADGTANSITSYKFLSVDNPGLGEDVTAAIGEDSISATVPPGTDVTALIATFAHTGVKVAVGVPPEIEVIQVSGQTKNDFTDPVNYEVTSADGTPQNYKVTVTIAAPPEPAPRR